MGFFIGLLGLPRWVLGMLVAGRQKKFSNQLADAIDVIVRGVKSGLPLNQCLRIIAAESPEPLRSEFQALCRLAKRWACRSIKACSACTTACRSPEVNFFSIVLDHPAEDGRQPFGIAGQPLRRAARAQADEGEGEGAVVGSESLGHDHRRAAA